MYVSRNIEARSRNHYCYGKWISITDSECVILALVIRYAKRMRLIMLSSGLSGSTIFPHIVIYGTIFGGGGLLLNIKCVFWFSLRFLCETFLIPSTIERETLINVRRSSCRSTCYSCYTLMKLEFCRQIFGRHSNIRFHENPSSGSRVVPCGRLWQSS